MNAPLCIAWYTDGKKEFVNSQTLLMLMKHREWRVQLTALQAYIHPKRTARGHYDQVHQVRVGADDITDNNAALDIVTKSLAMYSEKAYAVKGDDDMDGDDDMQVSEAPLLSPSTYMWGASCEQCARTHAPLSPLAPPLVYTCIMAVHLHPPLAALVQHQGGRDGR